MNVNSPGQANTLHQFSDGSALCRLGIHDFECIRIAKCPALDVNIVASVPRHINTHRYLIFTGDRPPGIYSLHL